MKKFKIRLTVGVLPVQPMGCGCGCSGGEGAGEGQGIKK